MKKDWKKIDAFLHPFINKWRLNREKEEAKHPNPFHGLPLHAIDHPPIESKGDALLCNFPNVIDQMDVFLNHGENVIAHIKENDKKLSFTSFKKNAKWFLKSVTSSVYIERFKNGPAILLAKLDEIVTTLPPDTDVQVTHHLLDTAMPLFTELFNSI